MSHIILDMEMKVLSRFHEPRGRKEAYVPRINMCEFKKSADLFSLLPTP